MKSVAGKKNKISAEIEAGVSQFSGIAQQTSSAQMRLSSEEEASKKMERVLGSRFLWINVVNEVQGVLSKVEGDVYILTGPNTLMEVSTNTFNQIKQELNAQSITNAQTAVWVQSLTRNAPALAQSASQDGSEEDMGGSSPSMGGGSMPMEYSGGSGMESGMSGGDAVEMEQGPVETLYLKLRAKNILPRKRETLNREYAQLVAKLFRQSHMFNEGEEETKVIGEIPSIDSTERWFDFVVQLKLMEPIVMEDKELQ